MFSPLMRRSGRVLAASLLLLSMSSPVRGDALSGWLDGVLSRHPELAAADARVAAARARAQALSAAIYNPELQVGAERSQSESATLGINQTFDFSGKRDARSASGTATLALAEAERAALRQSLATGILTSLVELQGQRAMTRVAQQRLDLLERFADIADRQYRAGDTGVLDRDIAALARTEALASSGRAEVELLKAEQAFAAGTRMPIALPEPSLPDRLPDASSLRSDYEALAAALPARREAAARADMAAADIAIARSETRGDPTFGLRGGREQNRGGGNGAALIGVQLTIPLFVRNAFGAELAAANAQAAVATIEAEAAHAQMIARMQAAAARYRRAHKVWQRWSALSAARLDSSIQLLDTLRRLREISSTEYLVQFRQLLDGRAAGEELRTQAWLAWAEWLDAAGLWRDGSDEAAAPAATEHPEN